MRLPLLGTLIAPGAAGADASIARSPRPTRHDHATADWHPIAQPSRADSHVLVLGVVPTPLHAELAARYTLHDGTDGDAYRMSAIVACSGTVIDAHLLARLRGVRIIVVLGEHHGPVDLGAATSHGIRVALTGGEASSMPQLALANLDACFQGRPLPSAIV